MAPMLQYPAPVLSRQTCKIVELFFKLGRGGWPATLRLHSSEVLQVLSSMLREDCRVMMFLRRYDNVVMNLE